MRSWTYFRVGSLLTQPAVRRKVRRKLLVLLTATIVSLSGVAACGQAVEDEVRQRVEEKVEQGKQRAKKELEKGEQRARKELEKGEKRLEQEGEKAKKELEKEVQKVRKQAEDRAGTRR
jgi:hypothetical protein